MRLKSIILIGVILGVHFSIGFAQNVSIKDEGETITIGENNIVHFLSSGSSLKIVISESESFLREIGEEFKKYIEEIIPVSSSVVESGNIEKLDGNIVLLEKISETETIKKEGFIITTSFSSSKKILNIKGKTNIGIQYGAYDFLELLGVRFFLPNKEFIPKRKAIFLAEVYLVGNPVYEIRGIHPHRHQTQISSLMDYPISSIFKRWYEKRKSDCAKELIDWLAKNKQNFIYGYLHFYPSWLEEYARKKGVIPPGGISLYPKDEKGEIVKDEKVLKEKYREEVKKQEQKGYSYVFIQSESPERGVSPLGLGSLGERVCLLQKVIEEEKSNLKLIYGIHGSYEHLPELEIMKELPMKVGTSIHTLLDRNLFGPCWQMYGLESYSDYLSAYKDLEKSREMWYFPEATWGVNYDIDVPIYRPYYLYSRWIDAKYLAEKGAKGHFVYTQGLEWLYWLNTYITFKLQWNPYVKNEIEALDSYFSIYREAKEKIKESFEKIILAYKLIDEAGLPMRIGIRGIEIYNDIFVSLLGEVEEYKDWEKNKSEIFLKASKLAKESYELIKSVESEISSLIGPFYQELLDCSEINYFHLYHHCLAYKIASLLYKCQKGLPVDFKEIEGDYSSLLSCSGKVKEIIKRRKNNYWNPEDFQIGLNEEDKKKLGEKFDKEILEFYEDGYVIKVIDEALFAAKNYFLNKSKMQEITVDNFESGIVGKEWQIDRGNLLEIAEGEAREGNFSLRAKIKFPEPEKEEHTFITVTLPETLDIKKGGLITFWYRFSDNKISSFRRGGRAKGVLFRAKGDSKEPWYLEIEIMEGKKIIPGKWYRGIIPIKIGTSARPYDYKIKELIFRLQDMPEVSTEFDFFIDDIKIYILGVRS